MKGKEKYNEKEIEEMLEKHKNEMMEERRGICQKNFSDEDIQSKKYTVESSCPLFSDNSYFRSDCLELKRNKKSSSFS